MLRLHLILLSFAALVLFPMSANAHEDGAVGHHEPAGYFSTVGKVQGAPVNASIGEGNSYIYLDYLGSGRLLVLGYDNKTPWLKMENNTVALNRNSPDYYLNSSPSNPAPSNLPTKPDWEVVEESSTNFTWADKRMQWTNEEDPAWLKDENKVQKVLDWQIKLLHNAKPASITGSLYWQSDEGKLGDAKTPEKGRDISIPWFFIAFPILILFLLFYSFRTLKPKPRIQHPMDDEFDIGNPLPLDDPINPMDDEEVMDDEDDEDDEDDGFGTELLEDDEDDPEEVAKKEAALAKEKADNEKFPPISMIDPL